jgi:hypothetical protein
LGGSSLCFDDIQWGIDDRWIGGIDDLSARGDAKLGLFVAGGTRVAGVGRATEGSGILELGVMSLVPMVDGAVDVVRICVVPTGVGAVDIVRIPGAALIRAAPIPPPAATAGAVANGRMHAATASGNFRVNLCNMVELL